MDVKSLARMDIECLFMVDPVSTESLNQVEETLRKVAVMQIEIRETHRNLLEII